MSSQLARVPGWAMVLALVGLACSPASSGSGVTSGSVPESSSTRDAPSTTVAGDPSTSTTEAPTVDRCGSAPAAGSAPVSVRLWEIFSGDKAPDTFAALVAEFNAAHPGIVLEVERLDRGDLPGALGETPSDQWPDIAIAQPQALKRLVDTGRMISPAECDGGAEMAAELLPVVRSTFSLGGELRGVPYGVSTSVLLFDATELRRAGVSLDDPPATLDELAAVSRQVVDSGVSPHGLIVYDWYGSYLVTNGAVQRGELIAEPDNGRGDGPVRVELATPEHIAALEWLADVVATGGGVWIGATPSGIEDLTRIIDTTDGGAITIHTTGSIGDIIAVLEAGSFPDVELGTAPMPGPGSGAALGGNGLMLVDHGDPARAAAAFEVMRWLAEAPQMARFVAATGYAPPSMAVAAEQAVVDAWAAHPQMRVGYDQILDMPGEAAAAGPVFGPSLEVKNLFFGLTSSVVEDGVLPEVALQTLTADINALLEQYEALVPS